MQFIAGVDERFGSIRRQFGEAFDCLLSSRIRRESIDMGISD